MLRTSGSLWRPNIVKLMKIDPSLALKNQMGPPLVLLRVHKAVHYQEKLQGVILLMLLN